MNNILRTIKLFLLLTCTIFTSCFEITEEVNMNEDGTGNAVLTIDMSASKENLKSYMKRGEVEGQKMPTRLEIEGILYRMKSIIQDSEGLSNFQNTTDFENFVFTFQTDFTNVESLNKAVNELATQLNDSPYPTIRENNFAYQGNQFKRLFGYPIDTSAYDKLRTIEQYVLEQAHWVSIYRFKKTITHYSNRKARLSPSKKALMMISPLSKIIKGEVSPANTITFE